jgi:DNA mismatch repair protein MutL
MNKIKILPEIIANQIAAGEVVERPASVVKELIENSLDAGAKRIKVEVESGGRRLIRVSDDGCGMSHDDAINCFQRHATSKISKLEDLSKIQTLGFRGEALASIASVAKIELVTKTQESSTATKVLIEGGRLIDVSCAARSVGTTISVRDLFFNTPARRKFMRSEATENYHLTAIVQHYALAYPEVSFILINQGREVLNLVPARDLKERIFQIFGAVLVENLLSIEGGNESLAKVSGFVSAPHERRSNREHQFFFVNRRFVRDRVIQSAVAEAFRSVLPQGAYPVAFVFLQIPYEEIDVNVHPAKIEVRFRRVEAVREAVIKSINQSLSLFKNAQKTEMINIIQDSLVPKDSIETARTNLSKNTEDSDTRHQDLLSKFFESIPENQIEKIQKAEEIQNNETIQGQAQIFEETQEAEQLKEDSITSGLLINEISQETQTLETAAETFRVPLPSIANKLKKVDLDSLHASKITPLGQLRNSYIVAIDDQGLLLIDQHVAHERILFEKFRALGSKIEIQNLLIPETVDLSPAEMEIFDSIEQELEQYGFRAIKLSGRTVAIKSMPADIPPSEVRTLFLELLSDAASSEQNETAKLKREDIRSRLAARLACKAAVKVNMKLTIEKMEWLIDNLLRSASPATCPHGRPIVLRLTIKDIERGFHRT